MSNKTDETRRNQQGARQKPIKGYKGFSKYLSCLGFQYEVGKTYEAEGATKLCENGFHFCKDPKDVWNYYGDLRLLRYCEVLAEGEIIDGDGGKSVCSKITIVREIPLPEFLTLVNAGYHNFGWCNNGSYNDGDRNDGDHNRGGRNRGRGNIGDWNAGNDNCGHMNIGDGNVGFGNRGNGVSGLFSTEPGCIIFNRYAPIAIADIRRQDGYICLMACIKDGRMPNKDELLSIRQLPNFDEKIMKELILGKRAKKRAGGRE